MQRPALAYQQSQIMTAMPGDILLALYDGAIRFVHLAKASIDAGDFAGKARAVNRATAILGELSSTLDKEQAPQVCGLLASLYGYYIDRLNRASVTMDAAPADEVLRHLSNLRETWQQAVHAARSQGARV